MDQYYFQEGYLEAGYLTVVKEASAGLTPYFVDGYLPSDYFDLEGNAYGGEFSLSALLTKIGDNVFSIGSWTATVSISATANVITSGQSAITAAFTQTSTISHIESADITALSNAQLEAAVRRIRDNNITASAAFSVAVDFVRTRNTASEEAAEFSFTAVNARSRDYASVQSAAFSLAGTIDNRTRDQSSSLTAEFAVTATISHIEGADLAAFSNASLSATLDKLKIVSATFTTSTSQSADAQRLRGVTSGLSSLSSVFARPKFGVTWIDANGQNVPNSSNNGISGASVDNSEFKFGGGSLKLESSFNLAGIVATTNANDLSIPAFNNSPTSNFSISFWVKGSAGGGTVYHLGNESLNLKVSVANNSVNVEYTPLSGQTANYSTVGTNNLTIQDWNFIEVAGVYESAGGGRRVLNIYVNGVSQGVSVVSDPTYSKLQNGLAVGNLGAMICSVATKIFWIDDFQYRLGTNALIGSLPTSQAQGSGPSTTRTLLNLNGTFDDTNYVIAHSGLADLTATTTVNANVDRFKFVYFEAALASSASTSVTGLRIKSSAVSLDSAFTQDTNTDLSRTRTTSSTQSSEFSQSSEAVKTASIASDLNLQATFTATISHIHGADLAAFSASTISAIGVVTRSSVSNQSSEFTSSTDNFRVRFAASDVNSAFTQAIDAVKTAAGFAEITAQASVSTVGTRVKFASSDFVSASSLSATVQRVKVASASLASEFRTEQYWIDQNYFDTDYFEIIGIRATKTASANIVLEGFASELTLATKSAIADPLYLTIRLNVTAIATAVYSPSKSLQAQATLTALPRKSVVNGAGLSAISTITAQPDNRTRDQSANLSSSFALSGSINEFQGLTCFINSDSSLTADNARIRSFDSSQSVSASQTATATANLTLASALTSQFAFTATISHIEGADLVVDSFATLTADALAGKFAESSQSAAFSQTANATANKTLESSLAVTANWSAAIDHRVRDQSASLSAAFSATCSISHILGADLVAESFASLTAEGDLIAIVSASVTSVANLTATADKFRAFNANLAASTSLFADTTKLVTTQVALVSESTILANATKIKQFSSTIASALTFTAGVREIDADSLNQFVYTIPKEIWVYSIRDEVPVYDEILYVIPNENWTYTIPQEPREIILEQETRIYNIRSS